MSKLEYSEIKPRKIIIYKEEPYEVVNNHVARTDQRKPQNQCRLRNLINGRVIPTAFHASDVVEEAEVNMKEVKFLFTNPKGEFWFCEIENPAKRFTVDQNLISDLKIFLKTNAIVELKIWTDENDNEKIIGIKLPIKMTFLVKEAPPVIKGNTASGGGKLVTIETGAQITVPFFIKADDSIIINTETGEYIERAR